MGQMGDAWDSWGGPPAGTQATSGWDDGGTDAGPIPRDQWDAFVDATRGGMQAQLYRKQPTYCQGYLGTIEIDPHDPQGMVDAIAADWGGQVIQVRPLVKRDDGSTGFGKGWMTLRISAPPKVRGVLWEAAQRQAQGGIIDTEAVETSPAVPQSQQPLAGVDVLGRVLTEMDRRNDARMSRLEQLFIRQQQQPASDPFGQLTQALGMLKKFRALTDELSGVVDDDDYDDDDAEPMTPQERLINSGATLLEKKIDEGWDPFDEKPTPKKEAAPSGGMRLIREGEVVAESGSSSNTAPVQPEVTPDAVASYLKTATPQQAVAMLEKVQAAMGPEAIERLMAEARKGA